MCFYADPGSRDDDSNHTKTPKEEKQRDKKKRTCIYTKQLVLTGNKTDKTPITGRS